MKINDGAWDRIITSKFKVTELGVNEVLKYLTLIFLFAKRDLSSIYKQTILGPLWLVLQPLITALAFMVIFGNLMGVQTGPYPKFLFFYTALVIWTLFAEVLQKTADTFVANSDLFAKVFFPRLVVPFSVAITAAVKFSFSLLVLFGIWAWYFFQGAIAIENGFVFITLPLLAILAIGLGLSFGLILAALTVKYRDLKFLIQFGIQLLMYFSPVIFPLTMVKGTLHTLISFNPMAGVIEAMRSVFLSGQFPDWSLLAISTSICILTLLIGLFTFAKAQRNFIDTI